MELKDYTEKVKGLINPLATPEDDRLHMAMGMVGEIGEVVDIVKKEFAYGREPDNAKVLEELGDFTFYVVGLAYMSGVSVDTMQPADEPHDVNPMVALATLADAASIAMFVAVGDPGYRLMSESIKEIVAFIDSFASARGARLPEVLDMNIKKLSVRYPGLKFDADRANNRDTDAEKEAMLR
jgi:hypothetical protein